MSSPTEGPQLQQIEISKLPIPRLNLLKQQLDKELDVFQESLQTLKIAQHKLHESGHCLDKITPEAQEKEILVPLTESMYVPGRLAHTENVLIDIGTGYYVERNVADAKDYFNRRVAYVTEQMEKIQIAGLEKSKIRDAIVHMMKIKIQALSKNEGASKNSEGVN